MVFCQALFLILPVLAQTAVYDGLYQCYGDTFTTWKERPDLVCPYKYGQISAEPSQDVQNDTLINLHCIQKANTFCACFSLPKWKYEGMELHQLFVEYISVNGSYAIHSLNISQCANFSFIETAGRLKELPNNFCDFPGILEMDISQNKISELQQLSCLSVLDTFNISYNRLSFLPTGTFNGMELLRIVDISHNEITHIEPNTFNGNSLHILMVDVSHNNISKTDYSNLFLEKKFCFVSYEHNIISVISNEMNHIVNISKEYINSSGILVLSNNSITQFSDPSMFGLSAWTDYGVLGFNSFKILFRDNNIFCDCNLYPLLKSLIPLLKRYTAGLNNDGFRCSNPAHMTHFNIETNFDENNLQDFICNYTTCPSPCVCYYQPYMNRIVINCSSAKLTDIKNIDIDNATYWKIQYKKTQEDFRRTYVHVLLSNNDFERIPDNQFLSRISFLDLSANRMKKIRNSVLRQIPNIARINFNNNPELKTIPREICRFKRSNVNISDLTLSCKCDDPNEMHTWLPAWLTVDINISLSKNPSCLIDGQLIDAKYVTSEYLGCDSIVSSIIIYVCVLAFMIGSLSFILYFRHELFIIYRRCVQNESVSCNYDFDLYIAFDDADEQLFAWIVRVFCPQLEYRGYSIFFPPRDMDIGDMKEEMIRENISRSRCCVFFLSKAFADESNQWILIEWLTAWQYYKEDRNRKIVCINYDQLRKKDIKINGLKAAMTCGLSIDFCRNPSFITSCIAFLGSPLLRVDIALRNRKPVFMGLYN